MEILSKGNESYGAYPVYVIASFVAPLAQKHTDAFTPLDDWYRTAKAAKWKNLIEVREFYPYADLVGKYTVFNIKGNEYRLIVEINYRKQTIYLRFILTHPEHDRGEWKR